MDAKEIKNEITNEVKSHTDASVNEVKSEFKNSISEVKSEVEGNVDAKIDEVKSELSGNVSNLQRSFDEFKSEVKSGSVFGIGKKRNAFQETMASKENEIKSFLNKETKSINMEFKAESDLTAAVGRTSAIYGDNRVGDIKKEPARKNHLRDILNTGSTSGTGSIRFNQEVSNVGFDETAGSDTTTTAGVNAPKAKGAAAVGTDIELVDRHQVINTITNITTIPEEWLGDVNMIESFYSTRLMESLMQREDLQILKGTGTDPQYQGINVGAASANTLTTEVLADAFFGAAFQDTFPTAGAANRFDVLTAVAAELEDKNYMADCAILNPTDYYAMVLSKGSDGHYSLNNTVAPDGTYKTFWNGIEVVKSSAQSPGTFTVFDKMATQYWMREGVNIQFDRSGDDFHRNNITVRAQVRGAVTNYLPNGIVTGTFASAIASLNA